ncbi:MAG TPA: hypothetical protein PLW09_15925 [Candidatus Kapabacteria bacterium]|jgi:hypothetical protein|nr:hypothetical protein [Ignavibacteria bacterium]HRE59301.1 hypothetical protein [Candidatus Kapabacteria bacterium]HRK60555.1 hypothetical protein [Candidatus Kapabacteria bacterium]
MFIHYVICYRDTLRYCDSKIPLIEDGVDIHMVAPPYSENVCYVTEALP